LRHLPSTIFDGTGNTEFLSNAAGGVVSEAAYTAWGSTYSSGVIASPFAWKGQSGQYTDSETGLVYCNARYYAPALGRFVSRDPISFAGGINVYGFCGGDPINYADPSGLQGSELIQEAVKEGQVAAPYAAAAATAAAATGTQAAEAGLTTVAAVDVSAIGAIALPNALETGGISLIVGEVLAGSAACVSIMHSNAVMSEAAKPINMATMPHSVWQWRDAANRCKLTIDEKKELRNEATNLWEKATGRRARWDDLFVHHRIPLEYSHLMRGNPNRLANLVAVTEETHNEISAEWTAFRVLHRANAPTMYDIMRQAWAIDARYGSRMRFAR